MTRESVNWDTSWRGFTIVELLVVIVVIALLAAAAFAIYTGIQSRALEVAVQSDVKGAADEAVMSQVTEGAYPSDSSEFETGSGTTFEYSVDNQASPQTFCITGTNGDISYYIDQSGALIKGVCSGHTGSSDSGGGGGTGESTWAVSSAPVAYWNSVLVSSDATKYILTGNTSTYYRSADGGGSWSIGSPIIAGQDVRVPGALSADGGVLVMSTWGNGMLQVARSTNLGTGWGTPTTVSYLVGALAASSSGAVVYLAETYSNDAGGGSIFRSANGGLNWSTVLASSMNWTAIGTSQDGSKVVAGGDSYLKMSGNAGSTWVDLSGPGQRSWATISVSGDGTKMSAVGNTTLYLSSDGGSSWTAASGLPNIREAAMSIDGSRLIAVQSSTSGYVYTSKDGGGTWQQETELGAGVWRSPAVASAAGKFVVLKQANSNAQLYIGQ